MRLQTSPNATPETSSSNMDSPSSSRSSVSTAKTLFTDLDIYVTNMGKAEWEEYESADVKAVLDEIQTLGRKYTPPLAEKTLRAMTPLISFVDRHAKSVDCMVQNAPAPAAIIWGCLRSVIRFSLSAPYYIDGILRLVEKFGSQLVLYNRYDDLYHKRSDFRSTLSATFKDAMIFLRKARDTLRDNKGVTSWFKRAWSNFEKEFEDISSGLKFRLKALDQLCTYIDREGNHEDRIEQKVFRTNTAEVLQQINTAIAKQSPLVADGDIHDLISWLSPADYHGDWRRAKQKRSPGTCEWVFEHPFVQAWLHGSGERIGWIAGNVGVGKTVLSAALIDRLESELAVGNHDPVVVAYFFFDRTNIDRDTASAMYRTILAQFARMIPSQTDHLHKAFAISRRYGRTQMTWSDEPPNLLQEFLTVTKVRSFIVLDGLEECKDMDKHLSKFLDVIRSSKLCQCLITSRDVPYIKERLEIVPRINMSNKMVTTDIDTYFRTRIDPKLLAGQDCEQLVSRLTSRADGQFLFAYFMVEQLNQSLSPDDLYSTVDRIPRGLDSYYDMMMTKLMQESSKLSSLAHDVFSFVFCSPRPIKWVELQPLLALSSTDGADYDSGRLVYKHTVLAICQPFVEHEASADAFRPAHSSMAQSLATVAEDNSHKKELKTYLPLGHQKIARALLKYMNRTKLKSNHTDIQNQPLLLYAISFWCHHFINSELDDVLASRAETFLLDDGQRHAWLINWLVTSRETYPMSAILDALEKVIDRLKSYGKLQTIQPDLLQDIVMILTNLDQQSTADPEAFSPLISKFERDMLIRDIARPYKASNRLEDGIKHFQDAKAKIGPSSEDAVWILNGLGILYDQQGNIDLALSMQQKALQIQESCEEPNELEQTLTLNEFGRLYRHQGKYERAQEYHLRVLDILRKVLPESSMEIIFTKGHLAKAYRHSGRSEHLATALQLHKEVLEARVKLVGKEHSQSIWDLSDLAKCYRDLPQLATACKLQEEATNMRMKVLGPNHHDTLWSLNDLGLMYEKSGNAEKALKVHLQALKGQQSLCGSDHPTTVWTRDRIQQIEATSLHEEAEAKLGFLFGNPLLAVALEG